MKNYALSYWSGLYSPIVQFRHYVSRLSLLCRYNTGRVSARYGSLWHICSWLDQQHPASQGKWECGYYCLFSVVWQWVPVVVPRQGNQLWLIQCILSAVHTSLFSQILWQPIVMNINYSFLDFCLNWQD